MNHNLWLNEILQRQNDYIFFVNSVAFLFFAALCASLKNRRGSRLPWMLLAWFGVFHGVNEWLGLVALVYSVNPQYAMIQQGLMALSFVFLWEFSRIGWHRLGCGNISRIVSYLLLAGVTAVTLNGTEKQQDVIRYLAGLIGGAATAQVLWVGARSLDYGGARLRLAALCMMVYATLAGLAEMPASFFPGRTVGQLGGIPVQLITGILIAWTAVAIWSAYTYEDGRKLFPGREKKGAGYSDFSRALLLLLILGGGWLAAEYVDQATETELREHIQNLTQAAAGALHGEDIAQLAVGIIQENHPAYEQIKHQMIEIKAAYPAVLWAYVMVQKEGRIYFFVDSVRAGEPGYNPPNLVYEQPPAELKQVFATGQGAAAGPYRDEWGQFVSGFAPVKDHFSGEFVGVFAVDIDARSWRQIVAKQRMAPICVTFLVWLLMVAGFLVRQRLLESAQRTAASEERLAMAMQGANDGLWDWNLETGEVYFSPQWQKMLGYDDGELPPRMAVWEKLLHSDDAARARTALYAYRDGESDKLEMEIRLLHKSGYYVDILSRAFALRKDDRGKAVRLVGTHVDISERNRVSRELLAAKEAAESATRTKSAFLANMSHEIRTPMNAILGFTQLMLRETDLKPSHKQSLETINRSGEHLLALIDDILEMSKIEAGRIVSRPEEFDLPQFMQDLEVMFCLRAAEKGLEFQVTGVEPLPGWVIADKQKLRQIFLNLISNALKFTLRGRVNVQISVVGDEKSGFRLVGEVEDTGPGIAAVELSQLFRAFSQTESGLRVGGGTGLGLAISREFALLMGGDITVNSKSGCGSCFRLEVPVELGCQRRFADPATPRRVLGVAATVAYRILVVDDIAENRDLLATLLTSVGFVARTVADGRQAVSVFTEWQPHLIFMDMRMPVMDGLDATRKIRELAGSDQLVIIGVSAGALPEEEEQALRSGVDRYIRKPFREEEIFAVMAAFLPITYLYEAAATPQRQVVTGMARVPAELVAALQDAIMKANFDRIMELLSQLEAITPEAAEPLRQLAARYEYDQLLELLTVESEEEKS